MMGMSAVQTAPKIETRATISMVLAIASAVLFQLPLISLPLAICAVTLALISRQTIRREPETRGTTFGLIGFLLGAGVLVRGLLPFVAVLAPWIRGIFI